MMSCAEIAIVLGLSHGSVNAIERRALRKLKAAIQGCPKPARQPGPRLKISPEQAEEARRRNRQGHRLEAIAADLGVSRTTVWRTVAR